MMVKLTDPNGVKIKLFTITGQASYRQLAKTLNINRRTIKKILKGERAMTTSIQPIANVMECSLSDIAEPA